MLPPGAHRAQYFDSTDNNNQIDNQMNNQTSGLNEKYYCPGQADRPFPNQNVSNPMPSRRPHIREVLENTYKSLEVLKEEVIKLAMKLECVTRQDPQAGVDTPLKPQTYNTPLASEIENNIMNQINSIITTITLLNSIIEL